MLQTIATEGGLLWYQGWFMGPPEHSTAFVFEALLALALIARCLLRSKRELSAPAASQRFDADTLLRTLDSGAGPLTLAMALGNADGRRQQ